MLEITVAELKARMDNGDEPFILDVRTKDEYEFANLGGHRIALDELPRRVNEISEYREQEIVVMCRSGGRSARAVDLLHQIGYEGACNLVGGILAWSAEIDPTMPRY